jgi:hypothetical protein
MRALWEVSERETGVTLDVAADRGWAVAGPEEVDR